MKIRKIFRICISGALALVILSAFVLVYGYTGVHVENKTGATDYKWEPGQWRSNMTEGFSWFRMDESGFNNAYSSDLKDGGVDILLMGGSHMEAVSISAELNTGYLLNELLPEYTYNIGVSGHTIYTCVKNMEDAVLQYQPSEYVILETGSIELSEDDMQKVIDEEYADIQSYDSGLVYMLQKKIPVIKTVYKNITDWRNQGADDVVETDVTMSYETDDYSAILDSFLKKAAEPVRETGAKLIIFYQPSAAIDNQGKLTDNTDVESLELFKSVCMTNDIIFVDMTEDFQKLYSEEHKLAHGFCNTGVGQGHLNQYGHRVIAEKLAEIIQEEQQ